MNNILRTTLEPLLSIMFPARCHVCGNMLAAHEKYICGSCIATLGRTLYHRRSPNPMELRFAGRANIERATALFYYTRNSDVAKIIQDIKYRNTPGMGRMLGEVAMRELFTTGFFSDIDVMMPIPIHFTKRMRRGFNQTEYICKGLSEGSGIGISTDLRALKPHATQTHKTADERLNAIGDIFGLRNAGEYTGRHVLLVDDVCTTGSTLAGAANAVLAAAPGSRVSLFTLAVTA